ncbi:MAG: hypothetical protein KGD65_04305 [Candidatus Lokiarchaeota archaeon]|nr:hypothetical protein [Candidatus Lokiarchaeota archaeon]
MGAGKVLALIGAIIALVSVALSFIAPAFFGWYRIEVSSLGITVGVYITGIGSIVTVPAILPVEGMAIFELIGGIVLIIGAIVCIVGAVKESKAAGIVGGILILVGPLLLILDLLLGLGDFAALIALLGGPTGTSAFWGSITIVGPPDVVMSWGIWIGAFLALGGGVLGLIGGAAV